jgi:hypothetical protein
MTYLAKKREALDIKTNNAYFSLNEELIELIEYVAENLPDKAKEIIYRGTIKRKESPEQPAFTMNETYVLQREGLTAIVKRKNGGATPELQFKTVDIDEFVNTNNSTTVFSKVCKRIEKIARKRKIEFPPEYITGEAD